MNRPVSAGLFFLRMIFHGDICHFQHGEYGLPSYGKDRQPGGSGEGADITSW
jgi:hypothetical protein